MLNVSSPSPLYDDQASSNISIDTNNKKNTSMFGVSQPSARPTLNNNGEDISNDIIFSESKNDKITYTFKIILLGCISVGKTAILERYISNKFNDSYQCTMRCEFKTKYVNINDSAQAKLQIWDTVGDEKFRSITKQYYHNADGILLVYDITSRNSFDNLVNWAKEIRDNAPADVYVHLTKALVVPAEGKATAVILSPLLYSIPLPLFTLVAAAITSSTVNILFISPLRKWSRP
jgi:small GTP-binding protein